MIDYLQVIPSTLIPDQNCYKVALLIRDMTVERDLSIHQYRISDKSCLAAENQIAQARNTVRQSMWASLS